MTQNDLDLINQPDPGMEELHRLSRVVKRARERGIKADDFRSLSGFQASPEAPSGLRPDGFQSGLGRMK